MHSDHQQKHLATTIVIRTSAFYNHHFGSPVRLEISPFKQNDRLRPSQGQILVLGDWKL